MLKWHPLAISMNPVLVAFYRSESKCYCGRRIKNNVDVYFEDWDSANELQIPREITIGVDCAGIITSTELLSLMTQNKYVRLLDGVESYSAKEGVNMLKSLLQKSRSLNVLRAKLQRTDDKYSRFFVDESYTNMFQTFTEQCELIDSRKKYDLVDTHGSGIELVGIINLCIYAQRKFGRELTELEIGVLSIPLAERGCNSLATSWRWILKQDGEKTTENNKGEIVPVSIIETWYNLIKHGVTLSDKQLKHLATFVQNYRND